MFFAFLLYAVVHDIESGYIPEQASMGLLLIGCIGAITHTWTVPNVITVATLLGASYLLYLMNAMGGGDVKIFCALSLLFVHNPFHNPLAASTNSIFTIKPLFPFPILVFILAVVFAQLYGILLLIYSTFKKKQVLHSNLLSKKLFYILIILALSLIYLAKHTLAFSVATLTFFLGFIILARQQAIKENTDESTLRIPFAPFIFLSLLINVISGDVLQLLFKYL